tara:strand:- start:1354 stop:1980 length:627 start_codon:yes stop_codon:yes gene_type:complete
MKEIPEQLIPLTKKYNLNQDVDFWTIGEKWIITHDGVMKIADVENIIFDEPKVEILHDTDAFYGVAMWGKGRVVRVDESGNDYTKEVWTTADATRENVRGKGGYYFNMCEKRWQDRLVLKLLSLYEYGLYSEEEAEEFKKGSQSKKPATLYMKNNIRQIFGARGDWKEGADAILKSLTKDDGQKIKELMDGGKIEEAIVEFYKLKKGE